MRFVRLSVVGLSEAKAPKHRVHWDGAHGKRMLRSSMGEISPYARTSAFALLRPTQHL